MYLVGVFAAFSFRNVTNNIFVSRVREECCVWSSVELRIRHQPKNISIVILNKHCELVFGAFKHRSKSIFILHISYLFIMMRMPGFCIHTRHNDDEHKNMQFNILRNNHFYDDHKMSCCFSAWNVYCSKPDKRENIVRSEYYILYFLRFLHSLQYT